MSRLVSISLLFVLPSLYADQYAYLQPAIARQAVALLAKEKEILAFCEPCGEIAGEKIAVSSIEAIDVNYQGMHEVLLNGKGIDLAYTFVLRGKKWRNVAIELGLTPSGVSAEISTTAPPRKPVPDL